METDPKQHAPKCFYVKWCERQTTTEEIPEYELKFMAETLCTCNWTPEEILKREG